jgi:hypothetical protein
MRIEVTMSDAHGIQVSKFSGQHTGKNGLKYGKKETFKGGEARKVLREFMNGGALPTHNGYILPQ